MASPGSEPSSWPEVEPEFEGEPEVQYDSRAEPEVEIEPELEPESPFEPIAEGEGIIGLRPWYLRPDPNWKELKGMLGVLWPLHAYFIGVCFLILAVMAIVHIIRISRMKRSLGKPYYVTLHCMLVICGVTRAVHFFADPYNSQQYLPLALSFITLHTYYPCMLSAFILVFITLFKVTRIRVITHGLFNPIPIGTVMVVSFLMTLSSDIIVAYVDGTMLYIFLCQVYFVVWGLFMSGLYGYLFIRVFNRIFMTRVKINRMSRRRYSGRKRHTASKDPEKGDISPRIVDKLDNDAVTSPGSDRPLLSLPSDIVHDVSSTGTEFDTDMTQVGEQSTTFSTLPNQACKTKAEYKSGTDSRMSAPLCSATLPEKLVNSGQKRHFPSKKSSRRRLFDFKDPDDILEARVPLVAKLVLAAALVFLLLSFCSLLSIIMGAVRIGEDARGFAKPWFWWGYETTMRLLEISMAAIISVIGAAPLYSKTKTPSDK